MNDLFASETSEYGGKSVANQNGEDQCLPEDM